MDTKLKNSRDRHWLGILLLILLTAVMAAATVSSYPYMRQKAIEQKSADQTQRENENSEFERLATQIMNFSYVIWHQQKQEENGRILSFSQTFYPGRTRQNGLTPRRKQKPCGRYRGRLRILAAGGRRCMRSITAL